ncbi:MAG: sugar ABC transporter permease, partial [Planctomycetes bacterium]|nr:sugar ABC transporter permease [Planctomycetota bacterium]
MTPRSRGVGWFLAPWAVGFVLLTLLPAMAALGLSVTRFGDDLSLARPEGVGLAHYRDALGVDRAHTPTDADPWYWRTLGGRPNDPRLYAALANSLFFTLIAVPLGLCTSLAVALLLNQRLRGVTLFRALVYVPHLLGGVATVMIWSWLLNPRFGPVNAVLRESYTLLDPLVRLWNPTGTSDWAVPGWFYSSTWCK